MKLKIKTDQTVCCQYCSKTRTFKNSKLGEAESQARGLGWKAFRGKTICPTCKRKFDL